MALLAPGHTHQYGHGSGPLTGRQVEVHAEPLERAPEYAGSHGCRLAAAVQLLDCSLAQPCSMGPSITPDPDHKPSACAYNSIQQQQGWCAQRDRLAVVVRRLPPQRDRLGGRGHQHRRRRLVGHRGLRDECGRIAPQRRSNLVHRLQTSRGLKLKVALLVTAAERELPLPWCKGGCSKASGFWVTMCA